MDEERRAGEELRGELEREMEELRTKLKDATDEVLPEAVPPVNSFPPPAVTRFK